MLKYKSEQWTALVPGSGPWRRTSVHQLIRQGNVFIRGSSGQPIPTFPAHPNNPQPSGPSRPSQPSRRWSMTLICDADPWRWSGHVLDINSVTLIRTSRFRSLTLVPDADSTRQILTRNLIGGSYENLGNVALFLTYHAVHQWFTKMPPTYRRTKTPSLANFTNSDAHAKNGTKKGNKIRILRFAKKPQRS